MPSSKGSSKNFSVFKKYLNPWSNKSYFIPPNSTKHAGDKSMAFQTFEKEKKKKKTSKTKKKNINYTTIRKQIPSFERSVESNGSTIKILKYPKVAKEYSNSSKSGSVIKFGNLSQNISKNIANKSYSLTHVKTANDSKIIRFAKYMKVEGNRKASRSKKKEGTSKWEIDLSKVQSSSSRRKTTESKKEIHSTIEEFKSISSLDSKSPDRQVSLIAKDDSFPMPPGKALKKYMEKDLNDYEQSEILDYKTIYFIGNTNKKLEGSKQKSPNNGYDDSRGDYKVIVNDHISYRYEILANLGQGSFGKVYKAFDHKEKKKIALKIIRNKKKFEFQANVEIKILQDIKKHDTKDKSNIIKLLNNFKFRNHIWLTFDLYSINLYELIKSNDHKGFPLDIVRRIAIQILQGLKFLKERNIWHWDLKPENILLKKSNKTGIKIIDLGSSCFVTEQVYTYIQSRFYRAPEIMLGIPYTTAIDMWSFAWICVELYTGFPLFPGESEEEQFSLIMEYKGIPPINLLQNSTRKEIFFDEELRPHRVKDSLGDEIEINSKALSELLYMGVSNDEKEAVTPFIKFTDACLHWDSELRLSPSEALHHEWISSIFGQI
jgi:dual specificity tyrosine-phosphorylation-regulated kinase 2/3/4